uniref:Nurim n=1 Tax=Salmo trutta TaxID=8032 RepID=A0A674BR81_SALTR
LTFFSADPLKLCQGSEYFPNVDYVPWSVALRDSSVLKSVVVDLGLLALLTVQHNLLTWAIVKQACQSVLGVLNLAMYCSTAPLALQILMHYWQPVTEAPCLGSINNDPWNTWFTLLCFTLHFLCWSIICSIPLIFDYPELLGIVYYECLGMGDLLAQCLFVHLGHLCLSANLALAHSLDPQDSAYFSFQLHRTAVILSATWGCCSGQ